MNYKITITEEIMEIRQLEIEADSFEEAHRLAYGSWVENGQAGRPTVMVNERNFEITDPSGETETFDNEPD